MKVETILTDQRGRTFSEINIENQNLSVLAKCHQVLEPRPPK